MVQNEHLVLKITSLNLFPLITRAKKFKFDPSWQTEAFFFLLLQFYLLQEFCKACNSIIGFLFFIIGIIKYLDCANYFNLENCIDECN